MLTYRPPPPTLLTFRLQITCESFVSYYAFRPIMKFWSTLRTALISHLSWNKAILSERASYFSSFRRGKSTSNPQCSFFMHFSQGLTYIGRKKIQIWLKPQTRSSWLWEKVADTQSRMQRCLKYLGPAFNYSCCFPRCVRYSNPFQHQRPSVLEQMACCFNVICPGSICGWLSVIFGKRRACRSDVVFK